jgi:hypothetical protein
MPGMRKTAGDKSEPGIMAELARVVTYKIRGAIIPRKSNPDNLRFVCEGRKYVCPIIKIVARRML